MATVEMAMVFSVMLKNSHQKKSSLPSNVATEPRTDTVFQIYGFVVSIFRKSYTKRKHSS